MRAVNEGNAMKATPIAVVLSVLMCVVSVAGPVVHDVSVGSFSTNNHYDAATVSVGVGEADTLYGEFQTTGDYNLVIWNHRLTSDGLSSVLRFDNRNARGGLMMAFGDSGFGARGLIGSGPERLDLWTPNLPLYAGDGISASLGGWVRAQSGCKPDFWVGPSLKVGRLSVTALWNAREGGDNCLYTSWGCGF